MHIRNPTLKRGVHISNTLQRWSTEHSCLGRSSQGLGNTGLCGLHQLTCARFQHVGIKKNTEAWEDDLSLSLAPCVCCYVLYYIGYIYSLLGLDFSGGRSGRPELIEPGDLSSGGWATHPAWIAQLSANNGDATHGSREAMIVTVIPNTKRTLPMIYIYIYICLIHYIYISHFLCVCCWTPFQRGSEAKWIAEFFFTWWLTS